MPKQAAGPHVADRHLAAIARVHVHAEKPSNEDAEALRIRLGIDDGACGDIGWLAARREKLYRLCWQRSLRIVTQKRHHIIV